MRVSFFFASALCLSLLMGCTGNVRKAPSDTPTAGDIAIAVDGSYQPLLDTQLYVFQHLYTKATVRAIYTHEANAYALLMSDSVRFAVVCREPNAGEMKQFETIHLKPRITKLAIDAVALVVHPQSRDTLLTLNQLQKVFSDSTCTWGALNNTSGGGRVLVVFDHPASANARFLSERFVKGAALLSNCFAVNSNEEVIRYVSEHPGALGVISVSWISDADDPQVQQFRKQIRLVSVAEGVGMPAVPPLQAYIALKQYPLTRFMFSVSREARAGLGTGLVSFLAGEKGQRMVLKAGMVPATMPVRIVDTK
jgi:phosphate transport system substrate-binding protein